MERIWIYQSNRSFNPAEEEQIYHDLEAFVDRWAAHNKKLRAGFEIRYNRFIILKVDEAEVLASGCSIDESVRFVQSLEKKYNISLFNRHLMAYKKDGEIKICELSQIPVLYKDQEIMDDTLVFNNLVQNSKEFERSWLTPFNESGFHRFKIK
jgi:hypothetical protein